MDRKCVLDMTRMKMTTHCTATNAMTIQPWRVMRPSNTRLNRTDCGRTAYSASSTAKMKAKRSGSMSSGTCWFSPMPVTVTGPTSARFVIET